MEDFATKCPNCKKKVSKKSKNGIAKKPIGCLPSLLILVAFFIILGGLIAYLTPTPNTQQKTEISMEPKKPSITFKTLRRWDIPAGGIGIELLVSEKATKKEVMALAQHLRSKYLSKGFVNIQIFDSEEAYLHRDDTSYPEKKYFKHYLISLVRNPKTGYYEINWMAKGRDH